MAFTTTNDIDIILFSKCIQHRLGHLFGHMKSFPFHWLAAVKDDYNVLGAWSGTNIPGSQSGVIINMEASKVQGPFSCWVCSDETLDWTKILPPKPKRVSLIKFWYGWKLILLSFFLHNGYQSAKRGSYDENKGYQSFWYKVISIQVYNYALEVYILSCPWLEEPRIITQNVFLVYAQTTFEVNKISVQFHSLGLYQKNLYWKDFVSKKPFSKIRLEWAAYMFEKEPEKKFWLDRASLNFFGFFLNCLGCSFFCKDQVYFHLYLFLQFKIWFILYISNNYSISVGHIFLSLNKENIKDLSSGSFFKFSLKTLSNSEDQNTASISLGLPRSTWSDIFTELLCLLTFCLNNLWSQNSML